MDLISAKLQESRHPKTTIWSQQGSVYNPLSPKIQGKKCSPYGKVVIESDYNLYSIKISRSEMYTAMFIARKCLSSFVTQE